MHNKSQVKTHTCNNAYQTSTKMELMQYLHSACFIPLPSTYVKAIHKNNLQNGQTWTPQTLKSISHHQ